MYAYAVSVLQIVSSEDHGEVEGVADLPDLLQACLGCPAGDGAGARVVRVHQDLTDSQRPCRLQHGLNSRNARTGSGISPVTAIM